jgi:hypothetical protein
LIAEELLEATKAADAAFVAFTRSLIDLALRAELRSQRLSLTGASGFPSPKYFFKLTKLYNAILGFLEANICVGQKMPNGLRDIMPTILITDC